MVHNDILLANGKISLIASMLLGYYLSGQILLGPVLLFLVRHPRDNLASRIFTHKPLVSNILYVQQSDFWSP